MNYAMLYYLLTCVNHYFVTKPMHRCCKHNLTKLIWLYIICVKEHIGKITVRTY